MFILLLDVYVFMLGLVSGVGKLFVCVGLRLPCKEECRRSAEAGPYRGVSAVEINILVDWVNYFEDHFMSVS